MKCEYVDGGYKKCDSFTLPFNTTLWVVTKGNCNVICNLIIVIVQIVYTDFKVIHALNSSL